MRLTKKNLIGGISCWLLLMNNVEAADSLSVVDEAITTGELLRNEAKAIADYHQAIKYISEAEKMVVDAEKDLDVALSDKENSLKNLADAEKWLAEAVDWLNEADKLQKNVNGRIVAAGTEVELRQNIGALQEEIAEIDKKINSLEASVSDSNVVVDNGTEKDVEQVIEKVLKKYDYAENMFEEIEDEVELILSGGEAAKTPEQTQSNNDVLIAQLYGDRSVVESKIDTATDRLDEYLSLQEELSDIEADKIESEKNLVAAKQNILEAQEYCGEAEGNLVLAKEYINDSLADLAYAKKSIDPIEYSRYFSGEMRYYSWKDDQGRTGYQLYQPYGFYTTQKDMEYGIQTAYVVSNNQSFSGGRVSTFTDTTVSIAKRKKSSENTTLIYGLNINLPTGKSNTATNASMSEDLVGKSLFGEGYNFTPNFTVKHKIGEEDTWSFFTSYSLKQSYENDRDFPGTRINPGSEWSKSIEWMHAGQPWQMLVGLSHSSYGTTSDKALRYSSGNNFDFKIYYNRVLTPKQELMVYYRYKNGQGTKYWSDIDFVDSGGGDRTHYYGVEWLHKLSAKHSLRLMLNGMKGSGQTYDPLTQLATDSRSKYSGLIGYDISIGANSSLSLELEHFYLKDKSGGSYHGNNFYIKYGRSF